MAIRGPGGLAEGLIRPQALSQVAAVVGLKEPAPRCPSPGRDPGGAGRAESSLVGSRLAAADDLQEHR